MLGVWAAVATLSGRRRSDRGNASTAPALMRRRSDSSQAISLSGDWLVLAARGDWMMLSRALRGRLLSLRRADQ